MTAVSICVCITWGLLNNNKKRIYYNWLYCLRSWIKTSILALCRTVPPIGKIIKAFKNWFNSHSISIIWAMRMAWFEPKNSFHRHTKGISWQIDGEWLVLIQLGNASVTLGIHIRSSLRSGGVYFRVSSVKWRFPAACLQSTDRPTGSKLGSLDTVSRSGDQL